MAIRLLDISDFETVEARIADFARLPGGGLVVMPTPLTSVHRKPIVDWVSAYKLPAIYPYRYFVPSGGLVSYGIQGVELYRQAADYVARILDGAKPSEMPIIQASRFELIVNLRTATALGLSVPRSLRVGAAEVVE